MCIHYRDVFCCLYRGKHAWFSQFEVLCRVAQKKQGSITHYKTLLKLLINGQFYTLYSDEAQNITTTEQLAIYSTFEHNKISDHYLGIIPISQLLASHLRAKNVLKAITKYLSDLGIELVNGRFFCMDTANVKSGEKKME